jgi:methionyl-tRNA synthetase
LDKTFANYWPADYHTIGKDILVPAHAVYWPIMLHVLNVELPKTLLVHRWWLIFREKMSRSAGNIVNPLECAENSRVDAFRCYFMREMTTRQDSGFLFDWFPTRSTFDLANNPGISRVVCSIWGIDPAMGRLRKV